MTTIKAKRTGYELPMRVFEGQRGTYLVFKTEDGSYHVFTEVEAKDAARDCAVPESAGDNTRSMWDWLWRQAEK